VVRLCNENSIFSLHNKFDFFTIILIFNHQAFEEDIYMSVSINAVPNFDQLSVVNATNVLYDQVIPACEAKGIKLSKYGNHAGSGSLSSVEVYNKEKSDHELFNVPRIQNAFSALDQIVVATSQYKSGSYGLKHTVEEKQGEYITNGDLIAAMIVKGHTARFAKSGTPLGVNCEFKVKVRE
jgi:hypothetical protein